jgi:hypothetical protein
MLKFKLECYTKFMCSLNHQVPGLVDPLTTIILVRVSLSRCNTQNEQMAKYTIYMGKRKS